MFTKDLLVNVLHCIQKLAWLPLGSKMVPFWNRKHLLICRVIRCKQHIYTFSSKHKKLKKNDYIKKLKIGRQGVNYLQLVTSHRSEQLECSEVSYALLNISITSDVEYLSSGSSTAFIFGRQQNAD